VNSRGDRTRARLDAASELLRAAGGQGTVRTHGDSMEPTLGAGAAVLVRYRPVERPRRGELIVFRQVDYLVVHRFLGTVAGPDGPRFRTRGDGAARLDGPVEPGAVVGTVVAIERPDGWRSLEGRLARAYGAAVALHALAWAGARATSGFRFLGALDRGLLRAADAVLFALAHRRVAAPWVPGAAGILPHGPDRPPGNGA
jgi:hypothetical protein